jgi:GH15 family glucan-1,4-alpha-glucosidase
VQQMPGRIEDYAIIGNCESAAMVGLDGSIDWLTLPRFDSAACFAALLGGPENGRWRVARYLTWSKSVAVTGRARSADIVVWGLFGRCAERIDHQAEPRATAPITSHG